MGERFNGRMLALARQVRRMSQTDLVRALGGILAQGTLSKIEHGRFQPEPKTVDALAAALRVRPSFFFDSSYLREPMVSYSRRRQKLSATELQALYGLAEIYRLNLRKCFGAIEIEERLPSAPSIDPDAFGGRIEDIAAAVRQRWNLPRGPVHDLTKTAEDAGVVIVPFDFGTPLIDGFCQHAHDGLPPLVFLNTGQPKDRWRFSLAHEIGHLVMHTTPNPEQERQANQFAASLLMPAQEFSPDVDPPSIPRFIELKAYWGVAIQALFYRAWQIGKISDRQFRYFLAEISRRGWRKGEPVDLSHLKEEPTTLRWVVEAHLNELGYTEAEMGDLFGLEQHDLRAMYPVTARRPKLRLIVNER
ncbi:MAG: XRE family transcriptional regulator [Acidisphaera sp.]|nr:XRE family transcriptional regulator [Acidisphaera sp.]